MDEPTDLEVETPMVLLDVAQSPSEEIPRDILDIIDVIHKNYLKPLYTEGYNDRTLQYNNVCINNSQIGTLKFNDCREEINNELAKVGFITRL